MLEKYKLFLEGLEYELIYYLEKEKNAGRTLYKVTLKEKDQKKYVSKQMYDYFKTISYAYGFEVVEKEKEYAVSSEESKDFYDTFLYEKLGDAFFDTLMN